MKFDPKNEVNIHGVKPLITSVQGEWTMAYDSTIQDQKEERSSNNHPSTPNLTDKISPDEGQESRKQDERQLDVFSQQMQGKAAQSDLLAENQISTSLAFSIAAQSQTVGGIESKKKQSTADYLLLDEIGHIHNQIIAMEARLEGQYGEHFALDLLADLVEAGKVSKDDYDRIAAINDENERRQATALLIQKGLDSGEITLNDLENHPWAVDWLSMHDKAVELRDQEAQLGLTGEKPLDEIGIDAGDQTANIADATKNETKFTEAVHTETQKKSDEVDTSFVKLGGLSINLT